MNLTNGLMFLLQGSAGAVSGYITNKYAVNMLFKEYTPFKLFNKVIIPMKLGGVIKHRKEEFIEEISALVERDIINGKTILSNVKDDKFKNVLNDIIIKFYNEELVHTFEGVKSNEICGFENMVNNISNEILTALESNNNIINNVIDKIDIHDNLTYELINEISEGLYTCIEKEISENNLLSGSLERLYDIVSHNNINEVLPENKIEVIENCLTESINSSLNKLFENDESINLLLDNIFELCDIKSILDKLQTVLYAKNIEDYISEDECDIISKKIYSALLSYINSENGQNDLDKIMIYILETIKNTDYTVYDLIPDNYKDTLSSLINSIIHKVVPYFAQWINKNKDDFDSIIEKSINEAIINMDEGIKKIIISKVRELFLDNVAAKNEIVDKIINYLNNYNMDEDSLNEISDLIISYLKNTKISRIFTQAKDNDLIDDLEADKILNFVKKKFEINGQKLTAHLLKLQLKKNIGELFNKDLYDIFHDKIKQYLKYIVIENKDSIKEYFNSYMNSLVSENIKKFEDIKIDNYIDYSFIEDNMDKIKSFVVSILDKNKTSIIQAINKTINKKLIDVKNDSAIRNKILISAVDNIKSEFTKNSNIEISQIILDNLCTSEVYNYTSNAIIETLENNLESLLRGRIKETVKNNLSQYDEDEICDLAQRFMGNELKPLSIFGGILGFICGILFGAFSRDISISGFYTNIYEQITSIVLMGAVGIFTNVIAISMLFKPYTQNKLLAKIPFIKKFSLGYIPAHKENMSTAIGNVIDTELLSSSYIKNILSKHSKKLKISLLDKIKSDNYKAVSDFLINSKNKIKNILNKPAFNLLVSNKNKIIKNINNYLHTVRLSTDSINKDFIDKIIEIYKIEEKIEEASADYINEIINGSLKINDIIYPELKEKIKIELKNAVSESSSKLSTSIKQLNIEDSNVFNNIFNLGFKNISPEIIESLCVYVEKNSINLAKKLLINNLNKIIDNNIYNKNTVETIFHGRIKIYIDKNLYTLTNFVVDKIKILLISNENYIKESVKEKINSSLNFFEKIAYTMAGGEDIVDDAVRILVEKNLPEYINERFFDVTNILKESLNNNIYKLEIKDILPNINSNNINDMINSIFNALENNEKVMIAFDKAIRNILNYNISHINENSLKALIIRFNEEFNLALCECSKNILINKSSIDDIIYNIIEKNILNPIYDIQLKSVFNEYTREETLKDIRVFFHKINLNNFIRSESLSLTKECFNNKSIDCIAHISVIEKYIDNKLIVLLNSDEFEIAFENVLSSIIDNIIDNKIMILDEESKYQITNKVLEAVLNSVINNSKEIITSLELKEITKKEIELMNPKEIHLMFLSFSGELFKKLYIYGIFGGIFGINLWIPIIAGIKETIFNNNDSKNVIEESKNTL